jgi:hypothetical protein
MPRYYPQIFVLIHPQSVFLSLNERLSLKPHNSKNNKSMMQSSSGEANSSSATQEIIHNLWNPEVHYVLTTVLNKKN